MLRAPFIQWPPLRRYFTGVATLFVVLFWGTSPVYAHKVNIFAYADGDVIKTESRFKGGRPARTCSVEVKALNSQDLVASGQSDEQGLFSFPPPSLAQDLHIVVNCGDGHRGSWLLESEDYDAGEAQVTPHVHGEPEVSLQPAAGTADNVLLRKIVGEEVEKKVAPLRRELARLAERKISLQDILGGIGYFLGLAGLAAYMRFKKNN